MAVFTLTGADLVRFFDVTGAAPIDNGHRFQPKRMEVAFERGVLAHVRVLGYDRQGEWVDEMYADEGGVPLARIPADLRPATDVDFQAEEHAP